MSGTLNNRVRERFRFRRTPSAAQASSEDGAADAGTGGSRKGFREDIEGLRAVAVIGVILFHAGVPGVGGGYAGVDVFFVISGFLITGLLWREVSESGTIRLRRFYAARARRLLPASATVGVIIAIGAILVVGPLQSKNILLDGVASALYVGNYRFALEGIDYLGANAPPSPFQHYWSLGVEEQFYLLWPAIIIGTAWFIRRAWRRSEPRDSSSIRPYLWVLGLIAAISFVVSLVATEALPSVAFFSLPTRAWELSVGGLLALTVAWWRKIPPLLSTILGWGGMLLIIVAFLELGRATPYPGTAALLPVVGTALVIGAGCVAAPGGCGRVLELRPMRAGGRLSYSWYLWHWPVLLVLLFFPPFLGRPVLLALVLMLVSGGLAWVTLRLIENPFRFAPRLRRSPARSLIVGGGFTAVAACVCVALLVWLPSPVGKGPPAPTLTVTSGPAPTGPNVEPYEAAVRDAYAQVQAAVTASADVKEVPSNLEPTLASTTETVRTAPGPLDGCVRGFFETDHPECVVGDTTSATTVALVGDSNAGMWTPPLREVAEQRKWRLELLAKAGCPMLDMTIFNGTLRRDYTECEEWRKHIVDRLKAERPKLIVLAISRQYGANYDHTSTYNSYDAVWTDKLTDAVRQFRDTGAKVLVLGPIPDTRMWVPNCLSVNLSDATACSPPTSAAVNRKGIEAEADATRAGGGHYADVTDLFCTAKRCPAIVGNTLVYHDFNHATGQYTRLLGPVIGALADLTLVGG
ncbi:acyltransferase family protein [Mycobacterium barrassiae]|uniref:acyltransferase family protein n=1 Tax=Mycobacterium barrassiae TaxID=319709 RepID=UPI002265984D|nr:acyltransferase [Mycobacterium barrassiae]MCV7303149.1 acyltransferase family protein [Mycobacterium barrassiae]